MTLERTAKEIWDSVSETARRKHMRRDGDTVLIAFALAVLQVTWDDRYGFQDANRTRLDDLAIQTGLVANGQVQERIRGRW